MKNLAAKPTDAEMLEVYGLYKQVTVGDCNTGKTFPINPIVVGLFDGPILVGGGGKIAPQPNS